MERIALILFEMTAEPPAASPVPPDADYRLDITSEVCPMTFVRTRLLIEKMTAGETAIVRLTGEEPLENVPASVRELGHEILSLEPESAGATGPDCVHLLRFCKR